MIKSIAGRITQDIYDGTDSRNARKVPVELHGKSRRLLDQINAAARIENMRVPPGNRLQALAGDRKGFWSIRVNDQWRVVFRWIDNDAYDVEITDYH